MARNKKGKSEVGRSKKRVANKSGWPKVPHCLAPVEDEFRKAFITGRISAIEIAEKYAHLGAKIKNVQHYLRSRGLTDLKREYQGEQEAIAANETEELMIQIREEETKALIKQKQEEAVDYQKWMSQQLKDSQERIEIDPDSLAKLDKHLGNVKTIAELAEKHYGLGKQEASEHAATVNLIMQIDSGDIQPKQAKGKVVDE